MDNFKSHFYDYGRWPLPGLAQARVPTEYGWTFSSARCCHAPLELPPPCLCLAFGTMSNVGKFLFDLCNEFSINILLLKLAADSCAPSSPPLYLTHTHRHILPHVLQFHLLLWQCIQFASGLCFGFGSRTCPNAFYSCLSALLLLCCCCFVTGPQSWQLISTNGRQEVHFPHCQRQPLQWRRRRQLWRHFVQTLSKLGLKARRSRYVLVTYSHHIEGRRWRETEGVGEGGPCLAWEIVYYSYLGFETRSSCWNWLS